MTMLLKLITGAIAAAAAVWLVPGLRIEAQDNQHYVLILLGIAAIMGLVNAIVKPITQALSFCLVVLTLGFFLLVINAAMLTLTAWLAQQVSIGFYVDGFWPALLGSIIISLVGSVVGGMLGTRD
ncbi:MAG: phage holin family protein [Propionibacteriaceae bacterium]|nr:phage holin family protein [Propionibacteriaceae bacterium]